MCWGPILLQDDIAIREVLINPGQEPIVQDVDVVHGLEPVLCLEPDEWHQHSIGGNEAK